MVIIVSIVVLRIPTTARWWYLYVLFQGHSLLCKVCKTNYLLRVGGENLFKVRIRIFHYFRIVKFNAWIKHEFIMCSIIRFHIIDLHWWLNKWWSWCVCNWVGSNFQRWGIEGRLLTRMERQFYLKKTRKMTHSWIWN